MKKLSRRNFIKTAGVASATAFVLPRFSIGKEGGSPNSKLNIACVGIGNIGGMAISGCKGENIVGICDVDPNLTAKTIDSFTKRGAKFFVDYREMLDKLGKDIDAVCVSTPDHTHFKITHDAMTLGKHVCVQKPLAHNIWQARELKRAKDYYKVKTQMMNQGHATDAIRMMKEWYDAGVLGDVKEVHVWVTGPNWNSIHFGKPAKPQLDPEPVPSGMFWDGWVGEGKYRDFSSNLHPRKWRSFWDYGTGMLGDWFCHTADAPVWILDLKGDCTVEAIEVDKNFDGKDVISNSGKIKWTFPARGKLPAVSFYWYDGGKQPDVRPHDWEAGKKIPGVGMWMIGDKHTMQTGPRPSVGLQMANGPFWEEFRKTTARQIPKTIPRAPKDDLFLDWIREIKEGGVPAGSNFDYAAQITEVALLGVLVQRFGGSINWDSTNCIARGRPELDAYIKEPSRVDFK